MGGCTSAPLFLLMEKLGTKKLGKKLGTKNWGRNTYLPNFPQN